MVSLKNFKKLSFLVYGLGLTGQSVVKFFEKNKIKKYLVWDDKNINLYKSKRAINLSKALREVNYIVLSPGINLKNLKKKNNKLSKFKKKIITDLDIVYLLKNHFKSIVVTGTNGKSTTCEIISHMLKKNKFRTVLGGNIGEPVLNLKIRKNSFLVIEASSFQLAYSKFVQPDYALLLNITNDHLDWHGNMKNYINSKFKIFELQKKSQYSILNKKFIAFFKKKKLSGKLVSPKLFNYKKLKDKVKNSYLYSEINDENMSFVFELSKLLKIKETLFFKSLNTFSGLPHRYEVFLKRKNCKFINDSKATSFQATKFALKNTYNTFWIVGGLPKKNDKINLNKLKKNIVKAYLIGKNPNFFEKQIKNKINYRISRNLNKALIHITQDIKFLKKKHCSILLSPASASYDQYLNFEKRGEEFKKLSKYYARKYI